MYTVKSKGFRAWRSVLAYILAAMSISVVSGCSGAGAAGGVNPPTESVTYTDDPQQNLANPHRGLYKATYELNKDTDYDRFKNAKEKGYNLVYGTIQLDAYKKDENLPDKLLTTIEKNLAQASASNVKLVFRIKYNDESGHSDPAAAIVQKHLERLKPLLQKYSSVISVIQAGIIGPWGEWHHMTGDYEKSNPDYKKNRKALVSKLLEIFPDKYVQLRTPMHKEHLYGEADQYLDRGTKGEITASIAYTDDPRAKIGYHDDCLMYNSRDRGTYPSDAIEFWQNYVINDTKYAPIGGETCGYESSVSCNDIMSALKKFRYSYLHDNYMDELADNDQSCQKSIQENLGYRVVAQKLDIWNSADELQLQLHLINKGYAPPYTKTDIAFVLSDGQRSYEYSVSNDWRRIYPNDDTVLKASFSWQKIDTGSYCLYLRIGQAGEAVRLSNTNLWDSAQNMNKLKCGITQGK